MENKLSVLEFLLCFLILTVVVRRDDFSVDASFVQPREPKASENHTKPWLIIFWSTYFGKRKLDEEHSWKKGECPVACEVTADHSREHEADGFVVHARDPHNDPFNSFRALDLVYTRKPNLHTRSNRRQLYV